MAGRRVENQRRQKYGTSSYVSGNTVRKLAAAPQRRYEEYEIPKEVEITEEDRIAIRKKRKAIHRANRLNFLYTVGVSAIIITIFAICLQYLNVQSQVKTNSTAVTKLQSELNELTNSNDELELEINAGIDYEQIYNTAVNELGMVYPERDQVITYDAGVSEYVKQYHDIP